MLAEVKQYRDWYESAAYIMNIMKSTDMDTWLNIMKYEGIKGDEISLHALARIYQRHVVIHTKSRPWTTIKLNETITESRLSEVCDIHLLYMGNHVYAELVPKAKDMGAVLTCPKTTLAPIAPLKTIGNLSTQSGMTGTNIDMIGANIAQIDVGAKLTHGRHATDTYDNTTNVGAKLTQEKDVTEPPYLLKIKDKPCKEKTRTSTNILDTMGTNITYEQVEVPVYGMPVFPTADPIIPLFPDFDEGNEGAQPEPTVKQTSVPQKDNTVKDCMVRIE